MSGSIVPFVPPKTRNLQPMGLGHRSIAEKAIVGPGVGLRPSFSAHVRPWVANVGHQSLSSGSALTQTPAGLLDCAFPIQDYVHWAGVARLKSCPDTKQAAL